jgi:hypothetical protein
VTALGNAMVSLVYGPLFLGRTANAFLPLRGRMLLTGGAYAAMRWRRINAERASNAP